MSFINININKIPKWIQNSGLYNNLKDNDDEDNINILEEYSPFLRVNNEDDFIKFINVCKYWCINKFPSFIFSYINMNKDKLKMNKELYETINEFEFKQLILILLGDNIIDDLIKYNYYEIVRNINPQFTSLSGIYISIKYNNRKSFQYFYENGRIRINDKIIQHIIYNDANECLEYLDIDSNTISNNINFICKNGKLGIIKYLHKKNYTFNPEHILLCIPNDNINCIKYLHETVGIPLFINNNKFIHYILNGKSFYKYNNVNVFEYYNEKGFNITLNLYLIIQNDNIDYLLYFAKKGGINKKYINTAIDNDSIKCFKYFVDSGYTITYEHIEKIKACHFDLIRYLISLDYRFDEETNRLLIKHGIKINR